MLDLIHSLFKKEFQLGHMAALMNHIANIAAICKTDYLKDGDAKNAAIDAVCAVLQAQKDVVAAPTVPAAPQV